MPGVDPSIALVNECGNAATVVAGDLWRADRRTAGRDRAQPEPAGHRDRAVRIAAASDIGDADVDIEVALHPERLRVVDLAFARELLRRDPVQPRRVRIGDAFAPAAA